MSFLAVSVVWIPVAFMLPYLFPRPANQVRWFVDERRIPAPVVIVVLLFLIFGPVVTATVWKVEDIHAREMRELAAVAESPKAWIRSKAAGNPISRTGVEALVDWKLKDMRDSLKYTSDPSRILSLGAAIEALEKERGELEKVSDSGDAS